MAVFNPACAEGRASSGPRAASLPGSSTISSEQANPVRYPDVIRFLPKFASLGSCYSSQSGFYPCLHLHVALIVRTQDGHEASISKLYPIDGALSTVLTDDFGDAAPSFYSAVLPVIVAVSSDSDSRLRAVAAHGLSYLGANAADAIATLVSLLQKDPDTKVRDNAAWALGKIGPTAASAIPALVAVVKDKSAPSTLPQTAANALGRIGKAAVPALIGLLHDPDVNVSFVAINGLAEAGPQALDAVADLIPFLSYPDHAFRTNTATALGSIGPKAASAIPSLEHMATHDSDSLAREAALGALKRIRKS